MKERLLPDGRSRSPVDPVVGRDRPVVGSVDVKGEAREGGADEPVRVLVHRDLVWCSMEECRRGIGLDRHHLFEGPRLRPDQRRVERSLDRIVTFPRIEKSDLCRKGESIGRVELRQGQNAEALVEHGIDLVRMAGCPPSGMDHANHGRSKFTGAIVARCLGIGLDVGCPCPEPRGEPRDRPEPHGRRREGEAAPLSESLQEPCGIDDRIEPRIHARGFDEGGGGDVLLFPQFGRPRAPRRIAAVVVGDGLWDQSAGWSAQSLEGAVIRSQAGQGHQGRVGARRNAASCGAPEPVASMGLEVRSEAFERGPGGGRVG